MKKSTLRQKTIEQKDDLIVKTKKLEKIIEAKDLEIEKLNDKQLMSVEDTDDELKARLKKEKAAHEKLKLKIEKNATDLKKLIEVR